MTLTVTTVNLNGIRAAHKRGFLDWLEASDTDVLLMQEVRAPEEISREIMGEAWDSVWVPCRIKGRAGVGVAVRRGRAVLEGDPRLVLDDAETDVDSGRWLEAVVRPEGGDTPVRVVSAYFHSGEKDTPKQEAKMAHLPRIGARMAELLAEETPGDLNEVQRRFVATILDNTEQAIGMAEDFLTQARLDHELFTLHLESVELRRLVRTLIQEMRRTVAAPMRLQEHGAPIRMVADRRLLRQAIANTVTNAVRHAGEHATITISVSSEEDTALITVADNGRGMTRAQREALFTPFRSQNSLEAPVSRGVGLGMVVTKQILTLHGGSVLVDSLASRGTSVYLTLPIRPSVSNGLEPGSPGEGGRTTPDADPASKHE